MTCDVNSKFAVALPPHPRQGLPSLHPVKGVKVTFLEFLPLFLQKESGVWGNASTERQKKKGVWTLSIDDLDNFGEVVTDERVRVAAFHPLDDFLQGLMRAF